MEDLGNKWTEEELAALERKIKKIFKGASKDLQKKADEYFSKLATRDKQQQDLLKAGKITEEQYKQWRLAQIGRGDRFIALRDACAERMTEANKVAVAYVNDTTPSIMSLNYNYSAYTIEQVFGDVGFTLWDEQTVKRLAKDDPALLPKRRVNAPKDLKWNKKRFTAEITAGILLGEPIGTIANRVQNLSDANRSGAIRNARTAVTGAQNAGRQASYDRAKEMGLQLRKRWIATKDNRTRHAHAMLDGQTVPLDKPFKIDGADLMFPGDPTGRADLVWNCRCTMRTVEKEGTEAEPRKMRVRNPVTGRNELVSDMTYADWEKRKISESENSPRKSTPGKYGVDWEKIQSTQYQEKFNGIAKSESAKNAVITRAKWALANRDGTQTEELYAVDAKSGGEIARITNQKNKSGVARTRQFDNAIAKRKNGNNIILVHNHPAGMPPSIGDINAILPTPEVIGVIAGHDGSVYVYGAPKKVISEEEYLVAIRKYKAYTDVTSQEKALSDLAEKYGFWFERK